MDTLLKDLIRWLSNPQTKEKVWWIYINTCLSLFRKNIETIFSTQQGKLDEKKTLLDNAILRDKQWKDLHDNIYLPFSKKFQELETLIHKTSPIANIREEKNNVRIKLQDCLNDLENLKRKYESDSLMFLAIQEKKNPNIFSVPDGVIILSNSSSTKKTNSTTQAVRKKQKKEDDTHSMDLFENLLPKKKIDENLKSNQNNYENDNVDTEIKYWIIENHDSKNFASSYESQHKNLYIKRIRYCPVCPENVQMEYIERPPSICCPKCALCIDDLDITSPFVYEKEAPNHTSSSYNTKIHFKSIVGKILGKYKIFIPEEEEKELMLTLRLQIINKGIKKVEDVTWSLVRYILSELAKKKHPKYKDFYPCVYQLTNALRGKPVLTLTDREEEEIYKLNDVIDDMWPKLKEDLDLERSNSMGTIIQLQLIFYLLDYPSQINDMFNEMKGNDKEKEYDEIIKSICEKFKKPIVCTQELCSYNNKKNTHGNSLLEALKKKETNSKNLAHHVPQIKIEEDELI